MKLLRKTVFSLLAALATQAASAADNLFGRIAMEGVDIVGSVTALRISAYDSGEPGYYHFDYDNKFQAQTTSPILSAMVSGGSTYHDGKIYAYEYDGNYRLDLQHPHWVIYDAKTFERLTDIEKPADYKYTMFNITYDPTTDKIYGILQKSAMDYCFVEIDPATGEYKQIGNNLDNQYRYKTIACDKKGTIFITCMESLNDDESTDVWYLYKIRKTDGRMVPVNKISMTNLFDGDTYINDTRRQSMFCNFQTGKMYWLYPSTSSMLYQEVTNLVELDTTTGVGTLKAYLNKIVLTSGAYFIEPGDKTPAIISDFSFDTNEPSGLTGKLKFKMPAEAYDGTPLEGDQTVTVKEGDKVILEAKAQPGADFTSDDITFTNEKHELTITVSNAAGDGPTVKRSFFVGYDIPSVCKNVKLTQDGLKTILTWDAPTVGVNGSPVDASKLTYKVVRYPGEITVAEATKECRFEETHPAEMTRYVYSVTPSVGQAEGKGVYSNNLVVGSPLNVPYGGPFASAYDMLNYYTIIDSNNDAGTEYSGSGTWNYMGGNALYAYSAINNADDWLISPPINYEAGKTYELTFSCHSADESYPEAMEVMFGNDKTPEALTKSLWQNLDIPMQPTPSTDNVYTVEFTVPTSGVYYYGFHAISESYHKSLYLHDISVKEKGTDGINANFSNAEKIDFITNLGGQRTKSLQKGVNIVRMADGKTMKVIVK